jgi:hypothetical protein
MVRAESVARLGVHVVARAGRSIIQEIRKCSVEMRSLTAFAGWAFLCASAWGGINEGLVAHYTFDEGGGNVARDASRNRNDAKIIGCLYVKRDSGFALDFNGAGKNLTNHVVAPDLKLTGGLTLSAWVYSYAWNSSQWSGLVYKSDATCGIRNFPKRPGAIHFRIDSQDLVTDTRLEPRQWYHIAAVFKPAKYMRLYINGKLDMERAGDREHIPDAIPTDTNPLLIGACGSQYFAGMLDEVRIYDRALEPDEISAVYAADGGETMPARQEEKIAPPLLTLKKEGCEVRVLPRGAMEVVTNGETWRIACSFSAPGGHHNLFSLSPSAGGNEDKGWSPQVTKRGDDSLQIVSEGRCYKLTRDVTLMADKVRISDTFTNVSGRDVGVMQSHRISTAQPLEHWFLFGVENATGAQDPRTPAINPTCFLPQEKGSLGIVMEDDILRNQLEGAVSPDLRTAKLGTRHFGIPKGASCTTSFTVYFTNHDYFDFINLVRSDWNVPQVTVPGPCAFLRAASFDSEFYRNEMAPHPDRFRAFLDRKNLKVFMLCPWYRYWDGFDFSDAEFKKTMQEAMQTIRRVEPDATFLACLETYYYYVPRSILGDTVPQRWEEWSKMPYEFALPPAATKIIDGGPWKDSVYRDPEGNVKVSRGDPGSNEAIYKTPPLCIEVYPEIGNHFFRLRMNEINYLLDGVGFDGVYMDMFGYGGGNYTYEKWDGHTVDIGSDGEIVREYADLALLTAPARKAWLENIISKGKTALVNFGQPNTRALQTVPYLSFVEGADIGHVDLAAPIPDSSGAAGCQLTAPIALAAGPGEVADKEMARVRGFLRYGVLYYHYYTPTLFPKQGEGSGEYGPINHMFPITPVRLGKGFIVGKERIITTVSHDFIWKGGRKPRVFLFDKVGKDKHHDIIPQRTDQGWQVVVRLDDWHDVAVVEE